MLVAAHNGDLVAADIDEETATKYIDRFLMYYCMTADKLTRTSVWVAKLEREGSQRGYVSLLVVLGVAGTGIIYGVVILSAWAVGILALCLGLGSYLSPEAPFSRWIPGGFSKWSRPCKN